MTILIRALYTLPIKEFLWLNTYGVFLIKEKIMTDINVQCVHFCGKSNNTYDNDINCTLVNEILAYLFFFFFFC